LEWKQEAIKVEREILSTLGFQVYEVIDHPHSYLLYIIKLIHGSPELAQVAWNYLNDSMRLSLTIRFNSVYIACAAIFLASRKLGFPLPEEEGMEWWSLLKIEKEYLLEIANEIMSLYSFSFSHNNNNNNTGNDHDNDHYNNHDKNKSLRNNNNIHENGARVHDFQVKTDSFFFVLFLFFFSSLLCYYSHSSYLFFLFFFSSIAWLLDCSCEGSSLFEQNSSSVETE
jgi:hypothetical protein